MQRFGTAPPLIETLANGLTVILAPMASPSTTVLAMVGVGSRYETTQTSGVSHFLEHMVFKGTKSYPTAFALSSVVDGIGAEWNAFTSKEYTGYYIKSAGEHLDLSLNVVSDMLLTPRLLAEDVKRERDVIVEEIHMYEDMPSRHVASAFEQMMYAGSGLGHDIIGTPETVRACSRESLIAHLERWYDLHNAVLVVAGDQTRVSRGLLSSIESCFSKEHGSRQQRTSHETIASLTTSPLTTGTRSAILHKDTQQAHFIVGFEGLRRTDTDQYAAGVLSTLLGGTMSSRLFTEVREKRGLCYYVHSDDDSYHDTGFFGASAGVDPGKSTEALRVVLEQLRGVATDGALKLTADEVAKAKNHVVGSTILHMEDTMAIAQFYAGRKLLRNEIHSPEEEIDRYRRVTYDDVVRVASRLCRSEKIYYAAIGPNLDESVVASVLT